MPAGLAQALRPQAVVGTRAELGWALALGFSIVLLFAVDVRLPKPLSAGALVVLPVLAAAWLLGQRLFVAVISVAVTLQVALVGLGELHPLMASLRLVSLLAVAMVGRVAAFSWVEMRRAHSQELTGLLGTSPLLGRSLDAKGVAAEAVRVAASTLARPGSPGLRRAALLRVTGQQVTLLAACDGTVLRAGNGREQVLGELSPTLGRALQDGRPAMAAAADLKPILGELAVIGGTTSWALAGVHLGAGPFGILAVASRHPSGFQREDMRLLDGIARVTALALETALRHAEVDELKGRLQHSVDLALEVGRTLDPGEVVNSILVRMTDTVRASQASLARVDGRSLVVESTYSLRGGPRLVPVDRHFTPESVEAVPCLALALATSQPVAWGRIDARVGGEDLVSALPSARHSLALPFVVGGRTTCLLVLGREDRPFGSSDLGQLEPMADVALLALRNAHLYAEAEEAKRVAGTYSGRLQQAIDAAADIGSGQELSDVLERVLRRAATVVRADRGSISRLDGDAMVLEYDFDPGGPQVEVGTRWNLRSSPLAVEAIRARLPMRNPVAGRDRHTDEMEAWMREHGIRHVIQCPLLVGRDVVGLLGLSRCREGEFTEEDVLTLQPLATLAGLLLRNARLLAEAREVGKAKAAFLNLAAHELRTPLTVIKGYLSLLEDGTYPVPARTREEAVQTLVAKAQELESLVEALLTTAKLEVGSLPCTEHQLDVRTAVEEAVERVGPRARLEDASIEVRIPEESLSARADPAHVGRILDNLLNNALTYSPDRATIAVQVRPGDPIEIAVRDHGQGIPAEQRERVFERFCRLDESSSSFSPGLGLGLSISRELAELNGGSLVLECSVPGEGSVFVLRLPSESVP